SSDFPTGPPSSPVHQGATAPGSARAWSLHRCRWRRSRKACQRTIEAMPVLAPLRKTLRSLAGFNYRLWAAGALVSNIGTWMQRTAQDWIVLTELTQNDATAVGIVMSLQFGPQFLLLPLTGYVADRFDRRRMLFFTQSAMG